MTEIRIKEPSAVNAMINEVFDGFPKNDNGTEWFRFDEKPLMPKELRDICNSLWIFFRKKKWYNGGAIPDELLYTKRNFRLINNIALLDAVELAYDCIEKSKCLAKTGYKKDIEIVITLRVMHDCHKKNIPQDHIAGILCLYLELCERVVLL